MKNAVKSRILVIFDFKEKYRILSQMGGTYTEIDGIFYPKITLVNEIAEQNDFCGKYGDMWKKHMQFRKMSHDYW